GEQPWPPPGPGAPGSGRVHRARPGAARAASRVGRVGIGTEGLAGPGPIGLGRFSPGARLLPYLSSGHKLRTGFLRLCQLWARTRVEYSRSLARRGVLEEYSIRQPRRPLRRPGRLPDGLLVQGRFHNRRPSFFFAYEAGGGCVEGIG